MTESELSREIKSGAVSGVYFFYGDLNLIPVRTGGIIDDQW